MNAMQVSSSNNEINELNKTAWNLRYDNAGESIRLATEVKQLAETYQDELNVTFAKLTIAQLMFWRSAGEEQLREAIEALATFQTLNNPLGISRAHSVCAGMYDQYGQYEKAMSHAQYAVKFSKDVNDLENKADCYTTLGLVYSRTFDYSQALKKLMQGLEIRKLLGNNKAIASSLNLIGRNLVLSKNYSEAELYYKESLQLREKTSDFTGIPWTYLGLASLYFEKSDLQNALTFYNKAELAQPKIEKRFELLCLIGRAKIYVAEKQGVLAITHLNRALEIVNELKIISLRAEIHHLLATAYELNSDFAKALEHSKIFGELQQEILSNEKLNQLKHQQISFSIETAQKEAEIHRLKNVELKKAFNKIASQHQELEIKTKEILDSIDYAKYIQDAYFPSQELFNKIVPDAFLFYKPKDIVSGDFYWFNPLPSSESEPGALLIAAADATGHGVPGAIMSVICCNALNDAVKKENIVQPDLILNRARQTIIEAFQHHGNQNDRKDGMDIALVKIQPFPILGNGVKLQFAGAYNPLWIIKRGTPSADSVVTFKSETHYLIEIRADRQPIGQYDYMEPFTLHETIVNKGDTIYMFSDGFADQFGGERGEKFKSKSFRELLLHIQDKSMPEQLVILNESFEAWKSNKEQVDDVCVIGIKI